MAISLNIVLALAATIAKVNAAMGTAFSTGPVADGVRIAESWATLTLPAVPTDNQGDASLWVGMGTSDGDLIQSIADTYQGGDWSLFAYTLVSTSASSQTVVQGDSKTASVGADVTFHYVYDSSSGNYTQDVIVGGSVVSTISTNSGDAQGWGSAIECAAEDCGTMPAHTWSNVSIILSEADSTYINTLAIGEGVTGTMTSDDDITFNVGTIEIPGWSFTTGAVTSGSSTTSSSAGSASSAAAANVASSSGASPSGVAGSSSGSGSYTGSSSGSAAGAQASGTPTSGGFGGSSSGSSSGAQSSGAYGGSGGWGGSSTGSSSGSQSSGAYGGSGGWGGSSTGSSSGSQSSGAYGSGGYGTGSSSGAQPSGGFGGSSTGSSSGAESTGAGWGSWGSWGSGDASWRRSRISRGRATN